MKRQATINGKVYNVDVCCLTCQHMRVCGGNNYNLSKISHCQPNYKDWNGDTP